MSKIIELIVEWRRKFWIYIQDSWHAEIFFVTNTAEENARASCQCIHVSEPRAQTTFTFDAKRFQRSGDEPIGNLDQGTRRHEPRLSRCSPLTDEYMYGTHFLTSPFNSRYSAAFWWRDVNSFLYLFVQTNPVTKLKLSYDRRSVGHSVLVSGSLVLFSVWKMSVSSRGAPSLTRGWVSYLLAQLLLGLARSVALGSKSRRIHDHILLSHLRLPQPGGPGRPYLFPPGNRMASGKN
jgi:hypothetical protein